VKDLPTHPIRDLWRSGILITLNSDDPPMFNTTLLNEYAVCHEQLGFSLEDLAFISLTSIRASLLPADERAELEGVFASEIERLGIDPSTEQAPDGKLANRLTG
jgi:adenosine deaminase